MSTIARPFMRWPGNKHDLLDQIRPLRPRTFGRYFEPFLGAGAMFWDVAQSFDGPCFLSDANADLVLVYRVIRDNVDGLIEVLRGVAARPATKDTYLGVRSDFNAHREALVVERAAWFIYLAQTGFNGLYSVGRNGYNVAWGQRPHHLVCRTDTLIACSEVLRRDNVHIDIADWRCVVDAAQPGDFVYFDSPYAPATTTEGFTGYTVDGFTLQDQRDLAAAFRAMSRDGVQVMASNSDTPLVRELYAGFPMHTVWRCGRMNCKGDGRGRVAELVICGGYTT